MNKYHHCLIYNKFRSCMMAVAETVGSGSKSRSARHRARARLRAYLRAYRGQVSHFAKHTQTES